MKIYILKYIIKMDYKTESINTASCNNKIRTWKNYAKSLALALSLAASAVWVSSCWSAEHKANKAQRKEIQQEIKKVDKEIMWNSEDIESIRKDMQEYYKQYVDAATYYNDHLNNLNDKYAKNTLLKVKKDALNAKRQYLKLLDKFQTKTSCAFWVIDPETLNVHDLDVVNQMVLDF